MTGSRGSCIIDEMFEVTAYDKGPSAGIKQTPGGIGRDRHYSGVWNFLAASFTLKELYFDPLVPLPTW